MVYWRKVSSVIVDVTIFLFVGVLADELHLVQRQDVSYRFESPEGWNSEKCPVPHAQMKTVVPRVLPPKPNMKFYLHEADDIFKDVWRCFMATNHLSFSKDNWDDHIEPGFAEHMSELWLFNNLQNHSQRTFNMTEADVNIVAVPAFASLYTMKKSICTEWSQMHSMRMREVMQRITNLPEFQSRGHTFLVVTSFWEIDQTLGYALLDRLNEQKGVIATSDKGYGNHHKHPSLRKVVIPYKTHYLADTKITMALSDVMAERTTELFFHGCGDRHGEGEETRRWIFELADSLPNADIKNICVTHAVDGERTSKETSTLLRNSRYCLIPVGDTATSRRLFDAMATGCVPIYVGDWKKMTENLPFPSTIDWSEVILYAGSYDCEKPSNLERLRNWLKPILADEVLWREMSNKARRAYIHYLSYTQQNAFVEALLDEIAVT